MAYYSYRKEGQEAQNPTNFEPFLKLPKEKLTSISAEKDSQTRFRFMPPWSQEGAFAKGTILHYGLGIKGKTFVCPNTVQEGSCPFCAIHMKIKGDDKYKLDDEGVKGKGGIRPASRFFSNVVEINKPNAGVMVFAYGITIFLAIKKYQDSGEFGDLFDPMYGRDLIIDRSVRGKITDTVMPAGSPSPLQNPDWLDQIIDLDTIIPPVDMEGLKLAFASHPWKVYSPGVSVQVPRSAPVDEKPPVNPSPITDTPPTAVPAAAVSPAEQSKLDQLKQDAARAQQQEAPAPAAAAPADTGKEAAKFDDLRARIMEKMAAKK